MSLETTRTSNSMPSSRARHGDIFQVPEYFRVSQPRQRSVTKTGYPGQVVRVSTKGYLALSRCPNPNEWMVPYDPLSTLYCVRM